MHPRDSASVVVGPALIDSGQAADRPPVVQVAGGRLVGAWVGALAVFRGIEYGHAERFGPPTPTAPWEGVRQATERGALAHQNPSSMDRYIGANPPRPMGEDCLMLTVSSPSLTGTRAVMVFLHGGAYMSGSGEDTRYDNLRLAADGDVVTVNISYRLGALGYLYMPQRGVVNQGLQDQIAALEWIQENIAAFGGDSANVTLFGQSAGAHAIATMMSTLQVLPFRRAILQSPPLSAPLSKADAEATTMTFLTALGVDPQTASVTDILRAQAASAVAGRVMVFAPVLETFEPPTPTAGRGLDILTGWTVDDSAPFLALRNGKPLADFGTTEDRAASDRATEASFGVPARTEARNWAAAGAKAATYRFDWRPSGSPIGSGHCLELALLLGSHEDWAGAFMLGDASTEQISSYGLQMRHAWSAFAKTGELPQAQPWLSRPPIVDT
jgi:para-nitrobenzyl esterase